MWKNIPDRLVDGIPSYKVVFMVVFVLFGVVSNAVAPSASDQTQPTFSDIKMFVLYLAMSVVASVILVPHFQRRLRSGANLLSVVQADHRLSFVARVYSFVYPTALYLFIPAILTFTTALASSLTVSADPSFAKSVGENSVHANVWGSIAMSLLACTEEVWRWAMICSVLLLMKRIFRSRWDSGRFRWVSMTAAIVVSSLLFGYGHIGEYPNHGWATLLSLSLSGVLLMACALLTRRFIVAMLIHFTYDFILMSQVNISDTAFTIVCVVTLAVVFLFLVLYMMVRSQTNLYQIRRTRPSDAGYNTQSSGGTSTNA